MRVTFGEHVWVTGIKLNTDDKIVYVPVEARIVEITQRKANHRTFEVELVSKRNNAALLRRYYGSHEISTYRDRIEQLCKRYNRKSELNAAYGPIGPISA